MRIWTFIKQHLLGNKSIKNFPNLVEVSFIIWNLSQMSYSLVVILELSGVSEVQYKKIMIIGDD